MRAGERNRAMMAPLWHEVGGRDIIPPLRIAEGLTHDESAMIYIVVDVYHGGAMRVAKWGNSLAVRLPQAMVEEMGLKEGDEIELRSTSPGQIAVERKKSIREAIQELRKYRGRMPANFKFDRDEANER